MLRSILVALDGSEYSRNAAELGIRWAAELQAKAVGVGVIDEVCARALEPVPIGGGAYKAERDEAHLQHARQAAAQALADFSTRATAKGIQYETQTWNCCPTEQLVQQVQQHDLLILGRSSCLHTYDDEGATLADFIKAGVRPVIAIGDEIPDTDSVVAYYDGSGVAARSLQTLVELELVRDKRLEVIAIDADLASAQQKVDLALGFLGNHGISAAATPIESSEAIADVLLNELACRDPSLLVLGMEEPRSLLSYFIRSNVERLLKEYPRPIYRCG